MTTFSKKTSIKYACDMHPNFVKRIPRKKKAWDLSRNKALKEIIKFHYSAVQNDRCAYCHQPLKFGGYGEAIEHIIPKSKKFRWMFHPLNLCLACYGCNTKKSHKEVLVAGHAAFGNRYDQFPDDRNDYKIIHPHFDKFFHHIEQKGIFFKAKRGSSKGKETIEICQLNRLDALYDRSRRKSMNKKKLTKTLMEVLHSSYTTKEEKKLAGDMIKEIKKRYNYVRNLRQT